MCLAACLLISLEELPYFRITNFGLALDQVKNLLWVAGFLINDDVCAKIRND